MRISDWSSDVCSSDLIYGSPDAFTFSSAAPRSAFPRHDPGYGLPGPLCSPVLCRLEGEVCDAAGSICDLADVTPGLLEVGQDQPVVPGVYNGDMNYSRRGLRGHVFLHRVRAFLVKDLAIT